MAKRYVVLTMGDHGEVTAEVISREDFVGRITPRLPATDTYYGGDYGIVFVDSVADLARNDRGKVLGPMPLLVFEVGSPLKPVKIESVTRYHID